MNTPHALVVDDEPYVRYVLESQLQRAGFTVVCAVNGEKAYELACADPPSLVITELILFTRLQTAVM